jgi:3-methyladenine DNA glycosylase AlkD
MSTPAASLIAELRSMRNERNVEGMRRFGITPTAEMFGIAAPVLRAIARRHRKDHALALELWDSGIHDARVLATVIDDPQQVTLAQANRWVRDLDNWAVTDSAAFLFDRTRFAEERAHAWSDRKREFEKRVAFSVMAGMAVHRKELPDDVFLRFLPVIERESTDERNFVRKAVNWALRQIGKRNVALNRAAVEQAERIREIDSRAARWIAADALRELHAWKPRVSRARRPAKK